MSGRVQLALNVNDIGQAGAFYTKLFGAGPAKLRRSSSSCWKTPARAAASTTSASRSPTPAP